MSTFLATLRSLLKTKRPQRKRGQLRPALDLSSYSYTPLNGNLNIWRASDGSVFRCSLSELLEGYADKSLIEAINAGELRPEELIVSSPRGQEEHELRHM